MKLQLLTLTTLLALSTAQNLSGEPPCATACLSSAISAAGCAETDEACQCGPSQSAIGVLAAPCLIASCSPSALVVAQSVGYALCAEYSAMLTAITTTVPSTTATVTTAASTTLPMSTSTSTVANITVSRNMTVASVSPTTSAPAVVSSSAAMSLLVSSLGGLAALFFGVVATL